MALEKTPPNSAVTAKHFNKKKQGMNVYPPAPSFPSRSSWVSVAGWRWPRACGQCGRGPGGLKALGASWRPGLLHPCQGKRAPASALEQTRGWREEWGCRLEAVWRSDPLIQWDSTACGVPGANEGYTGYFSSKHIKKHMHMHDIVHTTFVLLRSCGGKWVNPQADLLLYSWSKKFLQLLLAVESS